MYRIPIYKVMLVKDGSRVSDVKQIKQPTDVAEMVKAYLQGVDREHFVVVMLDTKNKVIGINTVSIGSLAMSIAHPREVFKPAILANAASIILAHNHPSGDPSPSNEDIKVTKNLVEGGQLLNIGVLDHIILGDTHYLSMKAEGLI